MAGTTGPIAVTPLLVVQDAARALDFYAQAFGAIELARYVNEGTGVVGHADLAFGEARISVAEEARRWHNDAPPSLGGSPVVLQLRVADVSAAIERACRSGAELLVPPVEFCGEVMCRIKDPFGHIWLVSQTLEELTAEEKQRRRDAWRPP